MNQYLSIANIKIKQNKKKTKHKTQNKQTQKNTKKHKKTQKNTKKHKKIKNKKTKQITQNTKPKPVLSFLSFLVISSCSSSFC